VDEEREQRGLRLGSVDERQALLRGQHERLQASGLERLPGRHRTRPPEHRSLSHQRQRDMAQGREIAAGAHAPLLGHDWNDPGVEERDERLDQLRPHAARGAQENIGPEQHDGPNDRCGERRAHAGGVTPDEIRLELGQPIGGDPDVGQLSEAGVDAINRLPRGDRGFDQAPAIHQLRACRGLHLHAG